MSKPEMTLRVPAECFEEVEPEVRADGEVFRRFRLRGTELVGTEVRLDELLPAMEVTRRPMEEPSWGVFFLDYEYGAKE